MNKKYYDLIGGIFLCGIGIFVSLYSYFHYPLGELSEINLGFFPTVLGIILTLLGAIIAVKCYYSTYVEYIRFNYRALIIISLSIMLFAVLLNYTGVIISTMISVITAGFADRSTTLRAKFIMSVIVALIVWIIFIKTLHIQVLAWPQFLL